MDKPKDASDNNIISTTYLILLTLGGCFLGAAPVTVKMIDLPPETTAFLRVALAIPFLAIGTTIREVTVDGNYKNKDRRLFLLIIGASIFFTLDLTTMHMAIKQINVAVATLLTNFAPFFVAIFGFIGITIAPRKIEIIVIPFALVGLYFLCVFGVRGNVTTYGIILSLLSAFFYALYILTVKKVREYQITPFQIMFYVALMSSVWLSPIYFLGTSLLHVSLTTWGLIIVLVLCGQVLGQTLVTFSLRYLSASLGALVLLIQPVIAALLSWLMLGERLSAIQLVGMTLIMVSIAVPAFKKN